MAEHSKEPKARANQDVDFPLILLVVLLCFVGVLIYIGYDYLRDDTTSSSSIALSDDTEAAVEDDAEAVATEEETQSSVQPVAAMATTEKKLAKVSTKAAATPTPAKTVSTAKEEKAKVAIPSGQTITHTVKAGETLHSIARRYNLSTPVLKALNPQIRDETKDMKSGVTQLKIKVKAIHTVGPGDILSKLSSKYGVSKPLIMAANAKTRDYASRGEAVIIPLAK